MKTREKSFTLLTLLLLAMAIIMLASCKKDDEPETQDQPLGMTIAPSQFEGPGNDTLFC